MLDFGKEQRRYHTFAKHLHPVGFAHNMRPKSVEMLFQNIGLIHIRNATVLEVGCGQGYLVNHFLFAKAKHVIGTEIKQQILDTIPMEAFSIYSQKQSVQFKLEKFEDTNMDIKVDIISIFIGNLKIVKKGIEMFENNRHLKILAFMVPIRDFKSTRMQLDVLCERNNWTLSEFPIHLSISGEQRRAIVLKKFVPIIDLSNE